MAWNEIPARIDPELMIQAYYVRRNVVLAILPDLSRSLFNTCWQTPDSDGLQSFRRSVLVGFYAADLIHALCLQEIQEQRIEVGEWFVHSGVTNYSTGRSTDESTASIVTADGNNIVATTREDCRITSTALANMYEADDVSLVVGRRTSETKFDLVIAGYREPSTKHRVHDTLSSTNDGAFATSLLQSGRLSGSPYSNFGHILLPDGTDSLSLLTSAIRDTVTQFRDSVHINGAWKLLYDPNGAPMHEAQHQGIFLLFSRISFGLLGITVDPNADHGSGATDFTLRYQKAVTVVEFKKDTKLSELEHGIRTQLPRYMKSAGATYGHFVAMCHQRDPALVRRKLNTWIQDLADRGPDSCLIEIHVIDCRKQRSASKL